MKNKYSISILIFSLLFFLSCSIQSSYQVKSFFFDGVPNPDDVVTIDTTFLSIKDSVLVVNQSAPKKEEQPITGSIHEPFEERKCFECHDEKNRTKGKLPQRELCFSCHKGFNKTFKVTHGPVDYGLCTVCHNPHKTEQKKLLYSLEQNLCLQCHEQSDVLKNSFHSEIGEQSCIECHNPHGGENRKFLNEKACLQCHTQIIENKPNLHGPVAAGTCAICHMPHDDKTPKLLVSTGNSLCLNCHNTDAIYDKKYHVKQKQQLCTQCHDPHGSTESFLLTKPSE